MDAQQEVQAQDNVGALQADAQVVAQEAATTEVVTPETLGAQTVAQSEGLAQPVQEQAHVADTVPAQSADTGAVAADPAPAAVVVKPLSQTAEHVRAWVEVMRVTAPHQSQKAFAEYLDENIASFDEFVAALAATGG